MQHLTEVESRTVYISIGNSDDKLTQNDWSAFHAIVNVAIRDKAHVIHGQWLSDPVSPWQNACWCIDVPNSNVSRLRADLAELAYAYRQDSIAWAEATTEFIQAVSA